MSIREALADLVPLAIELEAKSHFPRGRLIDGCPYTYLRESDPLVESFLDHIGGLSVLEEMITARQVQEPSADPKCGNWMLWTIFNEMEVSRVRK